MGGLRPLTTNQPRDNVTPTHTLCDNCCTRFEDTQFECGLRPLRPFGPVRVSHAVRMSHAVRTLEPNQPKDNVTPTHTLWDNCCTRFEDTRTGPKGLRGRRPHANCVSSNRVQQLSQSVCVGVTLSFGWLGSNVRTACDIRTACDTRTGPKGLRGRRPHANCVSSNRVQQLSQSVCVGV